VQLTRDLPLPFVIAKKLEHHVSNDYTQLSLQHGARRLVTYPRRALFYAYMNFHVRELHGQSDREGRDKPSPPLVSRQLSSSASSSWAGRVPTSSITQLLCQFPSLSCDE